MKRRVLTQAIEAQGAISIRHGGKHDWYQNPETKEYQAMISASDSIFAMYDDEARSRAEG